MINRSGFPCAGGALDLLDRILQRFYSRPLRLIARYMRGQWRANEISRNPNRRLQKPLQDIAGAATGGELHESSMLRQIRSNISQADNRQPPPLVELRFEFYSRLPVTDRLADDNVSCAVDQQEVLQQRLLGCRHERHVLVPGLVAA